MSIRSRRLTQNMNKKNWKIMLWSLELGTHTKKATLLPNTLGCYLPGCYLLVVSKFMFPSIWDVWIILGFILVTTFYFASMIVRSSIEELRAWCLGCVQFHVSQYLRYWKCNRFEVHSEDYFLFYFYDSEVINRRIEDLIPRLRPISCLLVNKSDDYFLFSFNRRIEGLIPKLCPISCFPSSCFHLFDEYFLFYFCDSEFLNRTYIKLRI